MSEKPASEGDIIAAIRKRLQETVESAMKSPDELAQPTKPHIVARKAKRALVKHKTKK